MYQVVNQKNAQDEQNDEYIYQKKDRGSGSGYWGVGFRRKGGQADRLSPLPNPQLFKSNDDNSDVIVSTFFFGSFNKGDRSFFHKQAFLKVGSNFFIH